MALVVEGKTVETDEEGYLADLNDWSENIATEMAKLDNADLTDAH